MNRHTAADLADGWIRAHGDQLNRFQDLYQPLRFEIERTLPAAGEWTVVTIDDRPWIAGAVEGSLILATMHPGDDETAPSLTIRRRPALASRARVDISVSRRPDGAAVERTWRFDLRDDEPPLVVRTIEAFHGFDTGPSQPELWAREFARQLGLDVPATGPAAE